MNRNGAVKIKQGKIQAAAPAYTINDRRSSSGWVGGGNRLIEAARPQMERKRIDQNREDFHRNITSQGRQNLMDLGRWMFWNIPALQGMVLEQANLATGTFIPQFYGANRAWGDMAENWLTEWHKIFDVAGPPFDYDFYLQSLTLLPIVDGDFGTLLTFTGDNYPMIQIIPAHRIGKYTPPSDIIQGGPYDGARITDGVIVNDYGRPLAYRVFGEGYDPTNYTDISARDMILHFVPLFPGQVRGLSLLASSAFNWQDSQEWDRMEMLAQKIFAAQTLIETNETGSVDEGKALIQQDATYDSDNNKTSLHHETMLGGLIRYFKAGSNSKLEPFHYDRPTTATQEFQNRKIRDAFRGTEWDALFSLDPGATGGASMRVVTFKINRTLDKRRRMAGKAVVRVDGYGISKAIQNGELPQDPDWWKFEHQGPGDVTADAKYDSDVGLQEVAQGFSTRKIQAAKRGQYWEELDAQREAEARSDLQRAQRLATEFKITIQEALVILRPPTPSGQLPQPAQQSQPDQGGQ